jgi:hypothetical protein
VVGFEAAAALDLEVQSPCFTAVYTRTHTKYSCMTC